jgi:hypothetical protein
MLFIPKGKFLIAYTNRKRYGIRKSKRKLPFNDRNSTVSDKFVLAKTNKLEA